MAHPAADTQHFFPDAVRTCVLGAEGLSVGRKRFTGLSSTYIMACNDYGNIVLDLGTQNCARVACVRSRCSGASPFSKCLGRPLCLHGSEYCACLAH